MIHQNAWLLTRRWHDGLGDDPLQHFQTCLPAEAVSQLKGAQIATTQGEYGIKITQTTPES